MENRNKGPIQGSTRQKNDEKGVIKKWKIMQEAYEAAALFGDL